MKPKTLLLAACAITGAAHAATPGLPQPFADQLAASYPQVESLYRDLHQHPELAFNEHETAAWAGLASWRCCATVRGRR
jgi:hypothetical protein